MQHGKLRELSEEGFKAFKIFDILVQPFILHFVEKQVSLPSTKITPKPVFLETRREVFHFTIRTVYHVHLAQISIFSQFCVGLIIYRKADWKCLRNPDFKLFIGNANEVDISPHIYDYKSFFKK